MSPGRPKLSKIPLHGQAPGLLPFKGYPEYNAPNHPCQTLNNLTLPERLAELAVITLRLESFLGSTIHTMQAPHRT